MHDPMTVAFEIKRPWADPPAGKVKYRYRPALVTIWHVDPERDGTDDSCGWSFPKPPRALIEDIAKDVRFLCRDTPGALMAQRAIEGSAAWWILWLQRASFHHKRRPLPPRLISRAMYGQSFPGNRDDLFRTEDTERAAWIIARAYFDLVRPWWRHPRWHLHHWKINVHAITDLKRFLFSRCAGCRRRFRWGYAPTTNSWDGPGPRWFRGEPDLWHSECHSIQAMPVSGETA